MEAVSAEAVADQLFNGGVTPIDITPVDMAHDVIGGLRALRLSVGDGKVELHDLVFFCRQMHTLLKAGVPIMQALRGLRETTQSRALVRAITGVSEGLDAGLDLTAAVSRHPKVFSPLFVSMVQVGETTGSLAQAFLQLSIYLEREKSTRDAIRQALRYPTIVLFVMFVALVVINLFVVPAFAKIYGNFNVALPLPTRIILAVSDFAVTHGYALSAGLMGMFFALRTYLGTAGGRYRWHRWKLHLPVVGTVILKASLARFSRSLAVTLRAGVPLVQGMTVVARAVDNEFIADRVVQMRDGVERGETIARTAAATALFPPLVLQMISVGEESGAVDELLGEVADYYDREVDYGLKTLSSAIEPILIGVIGVIVLVVALGVFLPMWDMIQVFRGR